MPLAWDDWTRRTARQAYDATPKPPLDMFVRRPNVAVHVRRGDVAHKANLRNSSRFVPDEVYVECLRTMAASFQNRSMSAAFHIFSDGSAEQLKELVDASVGGLASNGHELHVHVMNETGDRAQKTAQVQRIFHH